MDYLLKTDDNLADGENEIMGQELAKQLPITTLPAAWADAEIASGEDITEIERSKQPEDIVQLPMFLLTEIEELDTKFGKRYKYYITTPDGEQWNFTLGAQSPNGQPTGKLTQARIDMYQKFRAQPKGYVFALETVSTQLGQDGYRFTSPVQKVANEQARQGRASNADLSERLQPRQSQPVKPEDFLPDYDTPLTLKDDKKK